MKKSTKYSNKRRVTGHSFNGAEWLNTIQRSRTYAAETIPGSNLDGTLSAAVSADMRVRDAFAMLSNHQMPLDPEMTMDLLAHGLGVAVIRSRQIHPDLATNPAMPTLNAASQGLQRAIDRWNTNKAWGLDGPGRQAMEDAIEIYAEILRNSSPAQMTAATKERERILRQIDPRFKDAVTA